MILLIFSGIHLETILGSSSIDCIVGYINHSVASFIDCFGSIDLVLGFINHTSYWDTDSIVSLVGIIRVPDSNSNSIAAIRIDLDYFDFGSTDCFIHIGSIDFVHINCFNFIRKSFDWFGQGTQDADQIDFIINSFVNHTTITNQVSNYTNSITINYY